ncbi:hypothetical protein K438DRAFT_1179567 [Mycena galopus ATCC 62051]|nr:hypothetical protein K438DRAFT_1179567 [Mycena galopus ATCC 62051]
MLAQPATTHLLAGTTASEDTNDDFDWTCGEQPRFASLLFAIVHLIEEDGSSSLSSCSCALSTLWPPRPLRHCLFPIPIPLARLLCIPKYGLRSQPRPQPAPTTGATVRTRTFYFVLESVRLNDAQLALNLHAANLWLTFKWFLHTLSLPQSNEHGQTRVNSGFLPDQGINSCIFPPSLSFLEFRGLAAGHLGTILRPKVLSGLQMRGASSAELATDGALDQMISLARPRGSWTLTGLLLSDLCNFNYPGQVPFSISQTHSRPA